MKNIVLIGMPGSGKSTLGKSLAKDLNRDFCDIDDYIEFCENRTIEDIFKDGEESFRNLESKYTKEIANRENIIIATGGGVIKRKENIEFLKNQGIIIFIDRPIENIIKDIESDKRPLLKGRKEHLYELYKERYELYKSYSNFKVDNIGKLDEALNLVKECIES